MGTQTFVSQVRLAVPGPTIPTHEAELTFAARALPPPVVEPGGYDPSTFNPRLPGVESGPEPREPAPLMPGRYVTLPGGSAAYFWTLGVGLAGVVAGFVAARVIWR